MSRKHFNPAPDWPAPPAGWEPGPDWRPDPSWPAAPDGWQFWAKEKRPPSKRQEKRAVKTAERDDLQARTRVQKFGVRVTQDEVLYRKHRVPLRGVHARVETSDLSTQRVTATRAALLGPLSVGLQKRGTYRRVFIVVEGVGDAFTVEVFRERAAVEFAALLSALGREAHEAAS